MFKRLSNLIRRKYSLYRERHSKWHIFKHGVIVTVGFLFSPFSWWNDLFINFPIAWFFTWLPLRLIDLVTPVGKPAFLVLFIFNYWLTNIVGLAMMHYSGKKLVMNESKISFRNDLLIGLAYTMVMAAIFLANPGGILSSLRVLPPWLV